MGVLFIGTDAAEQDYGIEFQPLCQQQGNDRQPTFHLVVGGDEELGLLLPLQMGLYRKGVLLAVHDDRHGTVLLQPLQYGPEAGEHVPAYHILRLPDSPGEIGVLLRYGAFLLINQPKRQRIDVAGGAVASAQPDSDQARPEDLFIVLIPLHGGHGIHGLIDVPQQGEAAPREQISHDIQLEQAVILGFVDHGMVDLGERGRLPHQLLDEQIEERVLVQELPPLQRAEHPLRLLIPLRHFRPAQIPCEDLRHLLPGIQPVQAADSVHRQLDILIPGPFIERIYFFFR